MEIFDNVLYSWYAIAFVIWLLLLAKGEDITGKVATYLGMVPLVTIVALLVHMLTIIWRWQYNLLNLRWRWQYNLLNLRRSIVMEISFEFVTTLAIIAFITTFVISLTTLVTWEFVRSAFRKFRHWYETINLTETFE